MGLLTNDSTDETKLSKIIKKHVVIFALLSYVSGLVVFGLLLTDDYCDKTYFSDSALLPGLVNRAFNLPDDFDLNLKQINQEAKDHFGKIPYSWILSKFRQIGLEVYTHNFTLNYPFGSKSKFEGRNVYAILRAPRAPSTETIILSTPFRDSSNPHGQTIPGIALMVALAKYFAGATYWAKDIIFLISDRELVGMQAWLDAYHGVSNLGSTYKPVLESEPLEAKGGSILSAINLEIHGEKTSRVEIKVEGLNGQLVNLDLFNVAVELCTRESVTPTFHGLSHPFASKSWDVTKQYGQSVASMMISQGVNLPRGAHGLFSKYAIQSITLEGIERKASGLDSSYVAVNLQQIGRVIEGVFRSLNNLLEKFNRSYWFYLLPSTRRYISIGYYMIPFGLVVAPLLGFALRFYLTIDDDTDDKKDVKLSSGVLWNALPICFSCHFFGLLAVCIPYLIEHYSYLVPKFYNTTADLLYYTILSLSVLLAVNPIFKFQKESRQNLRSRKCLALLNLALLLSCLSLINFSLSFALALVYVPIASFVTAEVENRVAKIIRKAIDSVLLLLLHPMAVNYLCLVSMSFWYDYNETILTHLHRSFESQKRVLLYYIEDWYIYGNWMYFMGSAFLFPVWLQIWYL